MIQHVPIVQIKTDPSFSNLFEIKPEDLQKIIDNIQEYGFDESEPLKLWDGLLVDGYTRLAAARECGLKTLPVVHLQFTDRNQAQLYAIHKQTLRRQLTDKELLKLLPVVDQLRRAGRKPASTELPQNGGNSGRQPTSAQKTANLIGIKPRKVEKARRILKANDQQTLQQVLDGLLSIDAANKKLSKQAKSKPDNVKDDYLGAYNLADLAIEQLQKIRTDDSAREAALIYVRDWIERTIGDVEDDTLCRTEQKFHGRDFSASAEYFYDPTKTTWH